MKDITLVVNSQTRRTKTICQKCSFRFYRHVISRHGDAMLVLQTEPGPGAEEDASALAGSSSFTTEEKALKTLLTCFLVLLP